MNIVLCWLLLEVPELCIGGLLTVMSVRMEHFGSHWTDFREILNLSIFRKSVEKIQVSLKADKNNGYFAGEDQYTFIIISP